MKTKLWKAAGLLTLFLIFGAAYIAGVHAQPTTKSVAPPATTNWIGELVVGKNETVDAIAIGGPHPTVIRRVEIGLRSDGTLVWRNTSNAK